ncbi:hypothetical protein U91I_01704 [alpha proteobacterium U9-1i]|nr:hypothetical protein U91I_01704 [alpha proteobacterium U9-1i]
MIIACGIGDQATIKAAWASAAWAAGANIAMAMAMKVSLDIFGSEKGV